MQVLLQVRRDASGAGWGHTEGMAEGHREYTGQQWEERRRSEHAKRACEVVVRRCPRQVAQAAGSVASNEWRGMPLGSTPVPVGIARTAPALRPSSVLMALVPFVRPCAELSRPAPMYDAPAPRTTQAA